MIFYVFLDGIGFGRNDTDTNPFARFSQNFFLPLASKAQSLPQLTYIETDACLGVTGLPQSATGQTALWTGVNGAKTINRHLSGFPSFTLKKIIAKHSIVKVLNQNGVKADLLNSYSPKYFEKIKENPRYVSASTLVQMASNRPLKTFEDLREGRGIYMDITHEILIQMGRGEIPEWDPLMQVRNAYDVGYSIPSRFGDYGLCIYEYFITDKVGHDQNWDHANKVIHELEEFFRGYLDAMDPERDTLIVTSDHGNLEDLTTSRHTTNPVPTILAGAKAKDLKNSINSLTDITPSIYKILNLDQALLDLDKSNFHNYRIESL
ncbi:metalloenzyme [Leptospira sp. GIMC2001]|uniref:metalloenzyme n=1 Tax=Leptospira sp. GIMC2001 TaxID=1513297 RepID=UPI00234A8F1C|nr:metalloenzyme [Leptospira sp. GIMC2001]WCL48445.1 metalloenzyme [Leptospira sp. GIMC2001]